MTLIYQLQKLNIITLLLLGTNLIWLPNCQLNDKPSNLQYYSSPDSHQANQPLQCLLDISPEEYWHLSRRPVDGTNGHPPHIPLQLYYTWKESMLISILTQRTFSLNGHQLTVYFTWWYGKHITQPCNNIHWVLIEQFQTIIGSCINSTLPKA